MPIAPGPNYIPNPVVSPGVFTREIDQSQLAQGVANIGGAIVAPFPSGPAFAPTLVTSQAKLQSLFGLPDGTYYGPYAAQQYLAEQGQVTICRVGGLTGYKQSNPYLIYAVPGHYQRNSLSMDVSPSASYSYMSTTDASSINPLEIITINNTSSIDINGQLTVIFNSNTGSFLPANSETAAYAGTTEIVGTFNTSGSTVLSVYLTSSLTGTTASLNQQLLQALNESTLTTSRLSASYSGSISIVPSTAFYESTVNLVNPTFTIYRATGGCGAVLYVTAGTISGSIGNYSGAFIPDGANLSDPCVGSDSGSIPQILAVLANTQYEALDSNLTVPGFSGSVLTQITSSVNDVLDLSYSLKLEDGTNNVVYGTYNFSLDPQSSKYITSVFGSDPTAGGTPVASGQKLEAAYIYSIFADKIAAIVNSPYKWQIRGGTNISGSTQVGDVLNFTDEWSLKPTQGDSSFSIQEAITPWINSQAIAPWQGSTGPTVATRFGLFRVHTLSDGTNQNTSYKIEISNVKLAGTVAGSNYGSFTLSVRSYSDTDKKPVYRETYQNLNLDPTSANFIARRIGAQSNYIDFTGKVITSGEYANLSNYIRIEMSTTTYPVTAVPYGFDAYVTPIDSSYGQYIPKMLYSKASTYAIQPGKYPSGVVFDNAPIGASAELMALYPTSSLDVGVANDTKQYFAPLPAFGSANSIGVNEVFDLESDYTQCGVVSGNGIPSYVTADEATNVAKRKFVLGFQGGFDGQSPAISINVGSDIVAGNTQGLDCTNIKSAGSVAYSQCIAALSNADEWDINLIVTPGIFSSLHSYVVNLVVDMCEGRGDCFYIMDNVVFPNTNTTVGMISAAVQEASHFDSSYAATYYPWVRILDTNSNQYVSVPPSVVIPAVFAANDQVAAEWFAPAGLNRGGITAAVQLLDRTTHAERDTLYDGKVNPIAAFPGTGIAVWGQKTLQNSASALDRINVRRLLIALKKYIASTSKYLTFEQNVTATRNQFLSIVNPYLESVQQRSGLYAFKVIMDDTNNTPDVIDRNILYGQIYLQPAKSSEFILLDFNVMPTGATFPGA